MADPDQKRRAAAEEAMSAAKQRGVPLDTLRHVYAEAWGLYPLREELRRLGYSGRLSMEDESRALFLPKY